MTNSLFTKVSYWSSSLCASTLLIEDSVHRIVDPNTLTFINDKHFVIDSLRKVLPIPGSNMYCSQSLPNAGSTQRTKLSITSAINQHAYRFSVLYWWLIFQGWLTVGKLLPFKALGEACYLLAERAMERGYQIIGDSYQSICGWKFFKKLSFHINIESIKHTKIAQVERYFQQLDTLSQITDTFLFSINQLDYGELRGFPLGLYLPTAVHIVQQLRKQGLFVRFELNDSPWSQRYKVIYLPLGPHLSLSDIDQVCGVVKQSTSFQHTLSCATTSAATAATSAS